MYSEKHIEVLRRAGAAFGDSRARRVIGINQYKRFDIFAVEKLD